MAHSWTLSFVPSTGACLLHLLLLLPCGVSYCPVPSLVGINYRVGWLRLHAGADAVWPTHSRDAMLPDLLGASFDDMTEPDESLRRGTWFKLICGASYQELPRINSLALAYTLAGVDCIDVSADDAVVIAAREGIAAAERVASAAGRRLPRRPWIMVSVNDHEDLHFRKASFDASRCPRDCPRPCESVCPTQAITPVTHLRPAQGQEGVARQERCYGCGRCLSVCPLGLITAKNHIVDAQAVLQRLEGRIDALEIHTNSTNNLSYVPGGPSPSAEHLASLWERIRPSAQRLKAVALSFPYMGTDQRTRNFMLSCSTTLGDAAAPSTGPLRIWQTDGRPMSGDIGRGATLSAVKFGAAVLAMGQDTAENGLGHVRFGHRHHVQLAGGTNAYTAAKLAELDLLSRPGKVAGTYVSGAAFGGYARKLVDAVMARHGLSTEDKLQDHPEVLVEAVAAALKLVGTFKSRH